MVLNPLNSSNLEQLILKWLTDSNQSTSNTHKLMPGLHVCYIIQPGDAPGLFNHCWVCIRIHTIHWFFPPLQSDRQNEHTSKYTITRQLVQDRRTALTSGSLPPKYWSDEMDFASPNFFCASVESETSWALRLRPLNNRRQLTRW